MMRLTTLLSSLLIAVQALAASQAPPPPPSPLPLIPEAPTVVVSVRSLDDVQALWCEVAEMAGAEEGAASLHAALNQVIPGFAEVIDCALPLAMALRVPPIALQQEPLATYLLPLRSPATDVSTLVADDDGVAVAVSREGFAVLSSDPAYAPAAEVPDLVRGMYDGLISASLDAVDLFETNRAVIEMGLASAPAAVAAAAAADTTGEPELSPDQVEMMVGFARMVIASLMRVDAAADVVDDRLEMRIRSVVAPGSPLEFGPQPDFDDALALTRLLPPDALILQASALDLGELREIVDGLSSLTDGDVSLALGDGRDEAFADWWSRFRDAAGAGADVSASAVRMIDGRFAYATAALVPDPDGLLAVLVALGDELIELVPELGLVRLPDAETGGARVYGWKMDFETMLRSMAGDGGPEDEEMCATLAVLSSVSSEIRMCTRDGVLMAALDDDEHGIAGIVRALDGGRGVDARAAEVAARVGPGCREISYGDVGAIVNWALGMAPEAADVTMGPVDFTAATSIDGVRAESELAVDMEGLRNLVEFIVAMEAAGEDGDLPSREWHED